MQSVWDFDYDSTACDLAIMCTSMHASISATMLAEGQIDDGDLALADTVLNRGAFYRCCNTLREVCAMYLKADGPPRAQWPLECGKHPLAVPVRYFDKHSDAIRLQACMYAQCATWVLELDRCRKLAFPLSVVERTALEVVCDADSFFAFVANVASDAAEAIRHFDEVAADARVKFGRRDTVAKGQYFVDCGVMPYYGHYFGDAAKDFPPLSQPLSPSAAAAAAETYYSCPATDADAGADARQAFCRRSVRKLFAQIWEVDVYARALNYMRRMVHVGRVSDTTLAFALGTGARLGTHNPYAAFPHDLLRMVHTAALANVECSCCHETKTAVAGIAKVGMEELHDKIREQIKIEFAALSPEVRIDTRDACNMWGRSEWAAVLDSVWLLNRIVRGDGSSGSGGGSNSDDCCILESALCRLVFFEKGMILLSMQFRPALRLLSRACTSLRKQQHVAFDFDEDAALALSLYENLGVALFDLRHKLRLAAPAWRAAMDDLDHRQCKLPVLFGTMRALLMRAMGTAHASQIEGNELAALWPAMQLFERCYGLAARNAMLPTPEMLPDADDAEAAEHAVIDLAVLQALEDDATMHDADDSELNSGDDASDSGGDSDDSELSNSSSAGAATGN